MSQQEPLLELYREHSDKEKLAWVIRDYNLLQKSFHRIQRENNNLKVRNEKLSKKIKEDDLQYPSKINGQTTVSVKGYCVEVSKKILEGRPYSPMIAVLLRRLEQSKNMFEKYY